MLDCKPDKASPECTQPIRAPGSQTNYPRVHISRQAIPEFNGEYPRLKERLQSLGGNGNNNSDGTVTHQEKQNKGDARSRNKQE